MSDPSVQGGGLGWRARAAWFLLVLGLLSLLSLFVYRAALLGPFLSDDLLYIVRNPYVRAFQASQLAAIFDPRSDVSAYATGNYAPLHVLAHALEWQAWGRQVLGYHLVNLALHGLDATLLVWLLCASGVARSAALVAGAIFALHPANVEAVAWISQLKSLMAMALSLGALLAFRRRPLVSAPLFGLALLCKATAGFALPMAAALAWAWRAAPDRTARHGWGLGLWAAVFALFAVPQYAAFHEQGRAYALPYPDAWTQLRSIAAIGARYLAMAASGYGTAAFHEPEAVRSALDPWWLAGLVLALVLAARSAVTLRRRREEAAYWIGAAAAFAPISQVIPFYFGMADRYLYFMLPGLLGGVLLWGAEIRAGVARRLPSARGARALDLAALAAAALLALLLGLQARSRAALWTHESRLHRDAAARYPDGGLAHFERALVAVREEDPERALASLQRSADRGYHFVHSFQRDPGLAPLREDPRFRSLLRDLAARQIAYARERGFASQRQLRGLAGAHLYREEYDEAIAVLEAAVRQGGPLRPLLLQDLERVRQRRSAAHSAPAAPPPDGGS